MSVPSLSDTPVYGWFLWVRSFQGPFPGSGCSQEDSYLMPSGLGKHRCSSRTKREKVICSPLQPKCRVTHTPGPQLLAVFFKFYNFSFFLTSTILRYSLWGQNRSCHVSALIFFRPPSPGWQGRAFYPLLQAACQLVYFWCAQICLQSPQQRSSNGCGWWVQACGDPLGNIQSPTHDNTFHVNSVVPCPLIIPKAELYECIN